MTVLQTAITLPLLALFVDALLGGQGRIIAPWERAFTAWLYRRAWWAGPVLLVAGSTACAVSSERPLGVIGFGALAVGAAAVIVFGRADWQASEASAPIVVQRSRRHFRKVGVTDVGRWKRVVFLGAAALASPTLAWLSQT